jgi:asparagine synthase (glutamine-hydrolysing)
LSAIFGLFNLDGQPGSKIDLERMSAALASLGTEGGGKWSRGSAALGQRLMCFTPEDRFEQQPLVSADGRYLLVCDGRIDNRRELMCELEIPPVEADVLPDSAFVLHAYAKWGEDCVQHLVGFFAFAVWDVREERLLLARSPIGAPALFYHSARNTFAFASMPKGLFALPFVPRSLNDQKLADFLMQLGSEPQTTFYRDIYFLPTGHLLSLGARGLQIRSYWHLDLKREIRYPSDGDYVEAFDEIVGRVVADHLRSLTPIGIMMSGGLDSTCVAAMAAGRLGVEGKRLTAFTEVPRRGFDGPVPQGRYSDETSLVQAVAQMYDNLDLILIRTDGRVFLDDLEKLFFHLEAPFRNISNRIWAEAIFQEAGRRGMRVLLDGGQGNLTISRDGSGLLSQLLREGAWVRALGEARAMARQGAARSTVRALMGQGVVPILPTPLWRAMAWLRGKPEARLARSWRTYSAIHPDFAAFERVEERFHDREHDLRNRFKTNTRQGYFEALSRQDFGAYVGPFRAMFGVDFRSPLADPRIASFCLALPEEQYLRGGEPRSLVRRAMAGRLPPEVLANRKRGLQAADWFERLSGARPEIGAELDRLERSDLAHRMLDLARMRRLVECWPQEGWDTDPLKREYGLLLQQGLMVGRFLRWFEQGG